MRLQKGYELAKEYPETYLEPTEENLKFFRKEGIKFELDKIRKDLDRYRVHFDVWSSEQSIRDAGKVEAAINELNEKGYVYEKDGALWFETTKFGDDKDRVLRKQDGSLTYLVPDIAYHNDKCQRGFDMLVDFFGADHHGYIPRLKASMTALGNDAGEDSGEIGSRRETDMISYFFQCGTGMSQHIDLCLLDAQGGNPGTEVDGMFSVDITGKINLIGAHFGSQTVDGQLR